MKNINLTRDVFNELKVWVIRVYKTYEKESPSYSLEKQRGTRRVKNTNWDWFWLIAWLDFYNQKILSTFISKETKEEVSEMLLLKNSPRYANNFIPSESNDWK